MSDVRVNKTLYKIFLGGIKYTPITLMILFIIGFILNFFGIPSFWISCIGGSSLIFLILMYLISFVFQFCNLFRIPLYFITTVNVITIIDKIFILSINTIVLFELYAILSGITLVILVYHIYKNRNKKSKDIIIELYNRYCNEDCVCIQEV